jgi:hypothetical protein
MIVPVKEENIVLWGLALTMTSELVSYTQPTKEIARHGHVVPLVRMTKAYPKLSQWDLDGFVRLFCFANSGWRILKGENSADDTKMYVFPLPCDKTASYTNMKILIFYLLSYCLQLNVMGWWPFNPRLLWIRTTCPVCCNSPQSYGRSDGRWLSSTQNHKGCLWEPLI